MSIHILQNKWNMKNIFDIKPGHNNMPQQHCTYYLHFAELALHNEYYSVTTTPTFTRPGVNFSSLKVPPRFHSGPKSEKGVNNK